MSPGVNGPGPPSRSLESVSDSVTWDELILWSVKTKERRDYNYRVEGVPREKWKIGTQTVEPNNYRKPVGLRVVSRRRGVSEGGRKEEPIPNECWTFSRVISVNLQRTSWKVCWTLKPNLGPCHCPRKSCVWWNTRLGTVVDSYCVTFRSGESWISRTSPV